MKKKLLLLLVGSLAGGGCLSDKPPGGPETPHTPPLPPLSRPLPLTSGISGTPVTVPPTFVFANLTGSYRIEASSNLTTWWSVAEVYDQTEFTVVAEMFAKRNSLFFRLKPLN